MLQVTRKKKRKAKISRQKELVMIKTEVNEIKTWKTIENKK